MFKWPEPSIQTEFSAFIELEKTVHGQNEAKRSNASIGEALVDVGAIKWNYSEDELQ